MRGVNKVILVGNIGREPDVRSTNSGKMVAHFSLATNYKRQGEEQVEWHRITVWDKLADIADKYLHAGSRVYVEGRIHYDSYEKDGVKIPTCEIIAYEIVMLGDGGKEASEESSDLPF